MKPISENKQIFVAAIINYVALGLNILIAIFYTPFLLRTLGDIDYGIRSFATSFVAYANVIGSGISTAYLRFANIKKNEYGEEGRKDIDGVFFKMFLFLGFASVVIGILFFVSFYFGAIPLDNYSNEQIFVVASVVFLSFITLGIKFPLSVSLLILNLKRKFIFRNVRFLLSALFEYIFSFTCLILGLTVFKSQVIVLSLISLVSEIIFGAFTVFYLFVILKNKINFKRKVVDKSIWKEIIKFSFMSLLIIAVMALNDSTDRIILGFISPEIVTFYSLAVLFNAYLKTAVDGIAFLYTPKISEEATLGKTEELQDTFNFVSKICVIVLSFVVFGYVCCGKEFIIMWLGPSKSEVYYYSLPLLVGMIFLYPQHFSIQVHRAYGKQKFAAIALSAIFLLNVGISIGLVVLFNKFTDNAALGCIVGTLFTYICESIILSRYNNKKLGLKQNNTWMQVIINILIGFTIAIFVLRSFDLMDLNIRPLFVMLIKGVTYVLIFLGIQFVINKKDILKIFKRIKIKKDAR